MSDIWALVVLVLIAVAILVLRRYFIQEAFTNAPARCGVDMPPCPKGTRCANGYCFSD